MKQPVDLTAAKIRPFFHIKNFKDGIEDAILRRAFSMEARTSEYAEGYKFGTLLLEQRTIIAAQHRFYYEVR